ncbi:MAG: TetR/AcrR family transcriptional regulator [Microbacterium sp.]
MRESTRAQIVRAAFDVFSEQGFTAATIADITARAGVSRGLVSYHFGSKEQLVQAVLDEWFATFVCIVTEVEGAPDERLAAIIDSSLRAAVDALPEQRIVLALALQPSTHEIFAQGERNNAKLSDAFIEAVRDVFRERGADDPDVEEVMLRSLLEGVIVKRGIYGNAYPVHAARRWLYRTYGLGEPTTAFDAPADATPIRLGFQS